MTKGVNQKLKLLLLYQYFTQETDADHGVTPGRHYCILAKQEIHVDRKTLYQDFEELGPLVLILQPARKASATPTG